MQNKLFVLIYLLLFYIQVNDIKKDGKISARTQRNFINGVVVVTCTIPGLDTDYNSYVGVKFVRF